MYSCDQTLRLGMGSGGKLAVPTLVHKVRLYGHRFSIIALPLALAWMANRNGNRESNMADDCGTIAERADRLIRGRKTVTKSC
jgi:hypothetical protein